MDDPAIRRTLVLSHHSWSGKPEVVWTWDLMPGDFRIIGKIELCHDDLAASSNAFTSWESLPLQVLLQWRWDHDRSALLAEEEKKQREESEARRLAAIKRDQFLGNLTLDSLASHRWFPEWDDETRLPVERAREVIRELVGALRSEPKLTKSVARKALKKAVVTFNRLDASKSFIDTVEREEIYDALEYVMCAAKYPDLADSIDEWREW